MIKTIGVVIGRFQVAELTDAHKHIINRAINECEKCLIIYGVTEAIGTKRNPLSKKVVHEMLVSKYGNCGLFPLNDMPCDKLWSEKLDNLINKLYPEYRVFLYSGRDGFLRRYHGKNMVIVVKPMFGISGTEERRKTAKNIINSVDFRRGIIYSCYNQHPRVFPTVDIAVIHEGYVLMGKKPGKDGVCFIGGFVDPEDLSFEDAAIRELHEEVKVKVNKSSMKYVCSNRQDDWRYNKEERINTTLYSVKAKSNRFKIVSEFESMSWISMNNKSITLITGSHKKLFNELLKKEKI